MSFSKIIEISFSVLIAFIILCVISFMSLRPTLMEIRLEAKMNWEEFERATQVRNEALPGLAEALRGFESGHSKLVAKLIEARSVSMRPGNPDRFAAAVDEMDRSLDQIAKLRSRTPSLRLYQPFETYWDRIRVMSMDMKMSRMEYNQKARLYNGLLRAFPQNMISSLFGFVPLSIYGTNQNI